MMQGERSDDAGMDLERIVGAVKCNDDDGSAGIEHRLPNLGVSIFCSNTN